MEEIDIQDLWNVVEFFDTQVAYGLLPRRELSVIHFAFSPSGEFISMWLRLDDRSLVYIEPDWSSFRLITKSRESFETDLALCRKHAITSIVTYFYDRHFEWRGSSWTVDYSPYL